jgi:short-subunit dehydrogenase involved in D-alanine esterification of teichoic acids
VVRKNLICQISYDFKLRSERAALLRLNGYEVISICGNDAARLILNARDQHCVAFIVGHAAPEETRHEMVLWLKQQFPKIPVIAMNAPGIGPLEDADYNVKLDGPETWLPVITNALSKSS